jgi:hypothetical protein
MMTTAQTQLQERFKRASPSFTSLFAAAAHGQASGVQWLISNRPDRPVREIAINLGRAKVEKLFTDYTLLS